MLVTGATDQLLQLNNPQTMQLLDTKCQKNFFNWPLFPVVVQAASADAYKKGLADIMDRIVGHEMPIVMAIFYPQEHADTDFAGYMANCN